MATNKLDNFSLDQLNEEKQKTIKLRKQVFILMIVILVMMVITAIWRLQQGAKFSELVPFFVILLGVIAAQNGSFKKKLNNIDKEIQKRE